MKITRTTYRAGGFNPGRADKNVSSQSTRLEPGLGTDRGSIPADGLTPATLHWAGAQPSAIWRVNGLETVEVTVLEAGLRTSELEVVSLTPGTLEVSCNGETIQLEVI